MNWQNPVVIGLLIGLPGSALAYLGYRRAIRIDKVAAQTVIATAAAGSIQQVVDGLNSLVEALQADNRAVRDRLDELSAKITKVEEMEEDCKQQLVALRERFQRLMGAP